MTTRKTLGEILSQKKRKTSKGPSKTKPSTTSRDKWLDTVERIAIEYGQEICREYRFHNTRQWRFDMAIPALKIAIEYEGTMSKKSRHTSVTGYTGDLEKYNEASMLGWTLLRYNAMNISNAPTDVKRVITARLEHK